MVRTLNRWGRGLYFKFEESIGQEGLSKLSQINFSKLGKVNLNKLAKGKIKATNSEAVKFQKVAQEILKSKKKANFNILKRVEIFKLEK